MNPPAAEGWGAGGSRVLTEVRGCCLGGFEEGEQLAASAQAGESLRDPPATSKPAASFCPLERVWGGCWYWSLCVLPLNTLVGAEPKRCVGREPVGACDEVWLLHRDTPVLSPPPRAAAAKVVEPGAAVPEALADPQQLASEGKTVGLASPGSALAGSMFQLRSPGG